MENNLFSNFIFSFSRNYLDFIKRNILIRRKQSKNSPIQFLARFYDDLNQITEIEVNDELPICKNTKKFLFSYIKERNETNIDLRLSKDQLWLPILEKAYAIFLSTYVYK